MSIRRFSRRRARLPEPSPQLVQRPDLGMKIAEFFGLRHPGAAATVSDEITPVAIVANLDNPGKVRVGRGLPAFPLSFGMTVQAAAVAAQFAKSKIRNPAGSNRLLKLNTVVAQANVSTIYLELEMATPAFTPVDFATQSLGVGLDLTFQDPGSGNLVIPSTAVVSQETSAGFPAGQPFWVFSFAAGGTGVFPEQGGTEGPGQGIVLDEGDALICVCGQVNNSMYVDFLWSEIPKQP